MRPITEIIVHCAATRPEWLERFPLPKKIAEIRRWHLERGWSDIGYHYLIDRDGKVGDGRPVEKVGAHVKGHNTGTIGVCLIGGHGAAKDDEFSDHFTQAQDKALRKLITKLRREYPSIRYVSGHNQYANKGCPGFYVPVWTEGAKPAPISPPDVDPTAPKAAPWWAGLMRALLRR